MAAMVFLIVVLIVELSSGSPGYPVVQPPAVLAVRGSSTKLNCTFSKDLQVQKPSLVWMKEQPGGVEVQVYPSEMPWGKVNHELFHSMLDAGLLMQDLRGRDSGVYRCCITVLQEGSAMTYRGEGTRLTVTATVYDSLIACCPLGVFIAALLALHVMVYQQLTQYWKLRKSWRPKKKTQKIRVKLPNFNLDFMDLLSAL